MGGFHWLPGKVRGDHPHGGCSVCPHRGTQALEKNPNAWVHEHYVMINKVQHIYTQQWFLNRDLREMCNEMTSDSDA